MATLAESAPELEKQVEDVERRLDRLKSIYEQYFQGIERLEPTLERNSLHNTLQEMRKIKTRNTGLRFRINQLVARMNTYENYWNRITRQMEEGTYQRDVFKARYRSAGKMTEKAEPAERPAEAVPPPSEKPKEHPAEQKERPAAARAPSPGPAAPPSGLSDNHVKSLYDAYVTAKRRCHESTKGLTQDALGQTLRKQMTAIMNQYKCRSVEFKVVIKEGKAILKAVPKF